MSLDASATQYASSMDVNLVRNVFVPSYTFDGSLGQFVVQLDTNLRGNVTVGDNTTNYALSVNGSVVQTISTAANWSTIPAIQTVNFNGFGLCNISIGDALGPKSLYYNPSTQLITYSTTPSGGGITLPPGSNWGDYLYWDGTAYVVGDQNITLGANAGLSGQLSNAIAIGRRAGESNQRERAVAIGLDSGLVSQGEECVAVGAYTGSLSQEWYAVAVGGYAGQTRQGLAAVSVGWRAGSTSQGSYAVSVGSYAGGSGQGQNAIAIGRNAGKVNQISNSIILNATGSDFLNTAYRTVSGFYVDPIRNVTTLSSLYYDPSTKEITYGPTVSAGLTIPAGTYRGDYLAWDSSSYVSSSSGGSVFSVYLGSLAGEIDQGANAVAIGFYAGNVSQGFSSIAIGNTAGRINQGVNSIAIGQNAGSYGQISNSIILNALGTDIPTSGYRNLSGFYVAPVRSNAGPSAVYYDSATCEITYGPTVSAGLAIPTGAYFGDYLYWSSNSNAYLVGSANITLGRNAGITNQGLNAVALGNYAGNISQGTNAVSIGNHDDGVYIQNNQGANAVSIGRVSGNTSQGTYAISIGDGAGYLNQGASAVAIGVNAGFTNQSLGAVAIGSNAGSNSQNANAIAVGALAGFGGQKPYSIAIGYFTSSNQGESAIMIGKGYNNEDGGAFYGSDQGQKAIAIGTYAGKNGQKYQSVAIGTLAGTSLQGSDSIAIGTSAGSNSQGNTSIAIGYEAGNSNQGRNAIAMGFQAGQTSQHSNSIVINATDFPVNTVSGNSFYVAPIRTETNTSGFYGLAYNDTAKELVKTVVNTVQTISLGTGLSNSGTAQNPIINITGSVATGALFFLTVGSAIPFGVTTIVANTEYEINVSGYTSFRILGGSSGGGGGGGGGGGTYNDYAGSAGGSGACGCSFFYGSVNIDQASKFIIKIGGGGVGGAAGAAGSGGSYYGGYGGGGGTGGTTSVVNGATNLYVTGGGGGGGGSGGIGDIPGGGGSQGNGVGAGPSFNGTTGNLRPSNGVPGSGVAGPSLTQYSFFWAGSTGGSSGTGAATNDNLPGNPGQPGGAGNLVIAFYK